MDWISGLFWYPVSGQKFILISGQVSDWPDTGYPAGYWGRKCWTKSWLFLRKKFLKYSKYFLYYLNIFQYFNKNIIIWDPLLDLNVQQVKVKVEFCTATQLGVNLLSTPSLIKLRIYTVKYCVNVLSILSQYWLKLWQKWKVVHLQRLFRRLWSEQEPR